MKRKIKVEQEVEITYAVCQIFARYWEDAWIDGVQDDAENPQMTCIENVEHFYYNKNQLAWCPVINLNTGQIENWKRGVTASIHYKSCDENVVELQDSNRNEIKYYEGYVPNLLCPKGGGYGDYVIMDIDENGFIKDFKNNLDDMFDD